MFKSTITLPNGAVAHVECETAAQLAGVLASDIGIVTSVTTESAVGQEVNNSNNVRRNKISTARGGRPQAGGWKTEDILTVAKIMVGNKAAYGTGALVIKKLRALGVNYETWQVYDMTKKIKNYLVGGRVRGGGEVSRVLKSAGIAPGSCSTSSKSKEKKSVSFWSERDMVGMGRIVRQNLYERGVTQKVREYLNAEGDNKNRTSSTLHTLVCDLRLYFLGKKIRVSSAMIKALDGAGLYPVARHSELNQTGDPVRINRINAVQEA